jgi:hypothetical protein
MEGKLNEGFRGAFLDKWGYGVVSGILWLGGAG